MKIFHHMIAMSALLSALLFISSCTRIDKCGLIRQELSDLVAHVDGRVGIAVITSCGDTLTVNDHDKYTLMSVFKLHEALAVAHMLDENGQSLDSVVCLRRSALDPATWSPMLKAHHDEEFELPVSALLQYILQHSDNNASNYLFENIVSVSATDSFIRVAAGIDNFQLTLTERQMKEKPLSSVENWSSPLACAVLMNKVFTDSLVSDVKQQYIQDVMLECQTGHDRIYDAIKNCPELRLAHKTGSGYRNGNGRLMAHNDIGHVIMPDGRSMTIAILINDFNGSEDEASQIISSIARIIISNERVCR